VETLALLRAETLRCRPDALATLMADHTAYDHRPTLPTIAPSIDCLVVAGGASGVFPPLGCERAAELIPRCAKVCVPGAGHWLYLELPRGFSRLLLGFAARGVEGVDADAAARMLRDE
jgi:pimeloyl-ACP methyl ester carboxylesterase